jgi:hypothetical protein
MYGTYRHRHATGNFCVLVGTATRFKPYDKEQKSIYGAYAMYVYVESFVLYEYVYGTYPLLLRVRVDTDTRFSRTMMNVIKLYEQNWRKGINL